MTLPRRVRIVEQQTQLDIFAQQIHLFLLGIAGAHDFEASLQFVVHEHSGLHDLLDHVDDQVSNVGVGLQSRCDRTVIARQDC